MKTSTPYSDLNSECREIRLLTIHFGPLTGKLFCELNAASLNHNPAYIALSYCWGDGVERNDITVNGHKFSIMASLATALQYLREIDNDVLVWADAICINQNNVAERNSQVRMMGNIYGRGKQELYLTPCGIERVNVWKLLKCGYGLGNLMTIVILRWIT
jgi:hypothetical protein